MSQNNTEIRALKVASVTGLASVLAIAMQIVTVPTCLKYWGNESYGMWLALFSLFAMLQTTGSGFVNYVGNQINILYHRDLPALQSTLASALLGVFLLGSLQLTVILTLIGLGMLPGLIGTSVARADINHAHLALLTLAGSWVLGGFYLGIVHRLLVPAGMMYQAAWWSLCSQLTLFLVVICAALFRTSLLQASLTYAIVQFIYIFASAWYVRCKLPVFYPWWKGFSVAQGLHDLQQSMSLTTSGIIQQGASNALVLIVSVFSGASAVPVFTTVRTLANLWTNITNVLTTPLLPDVVRFHAKGEWKKLLAVQETHSVLVGTAVNLSMLLAFPFIDPFYRHWTQHTVALNKFLLCVLLASVSLLNLGAMMNIFLTGINHHRTIFSTTLARGAVSLILGALLVQVLGLSGLGLGIWTGELLTLLLLIYFFFKQARLLGELDSARHSLSPPLLGVASLHIFFAVEILTSFNGPWLHLLAILGVCVSAFWGWVRLDTSVRARLHHLVSKRLSLKGVL